MHLIGIDSIIIQKADKGNMFVITNKEIYLNQMEESLSDTSKFREITFNAKHKVNKKLRHLLDMESNIKVCLDTLRDNNYLLEEDHKFM